MTFGSIGSPRAALARDAIHQVGEAARALLTANGLSPEMAEVVGALSQSPTLERRKDIDVLLAFGVATDGQAMLAKDPIPPARQGDSEARMLAAPASGIAGPQARLHGQVEEHTAASGANLSR